MASSADGTETEPGIASESPIIGGRATKGDPAVVAITRNGGSPHCTGTVIAPRAVLTAGHCLHDFDLHRLEALFFAGDVQAPGPESRRLRFSRGWVHEGYPADMSFDIALLELEEDAPVKPVPLNRTALGSRLVGQSLRLVGYGKTGPDMRAGPKRETPALVLKLEDRKIVHEPNTCPGDSGGPAFLRIDGREVLVGVHSTGSCGGGSPSVKVRVDRNLDFIAGALARVPSAVAVPQDTPPPELPQKIAVTVWGAKGTTTQHRLRCAPGRGSLAIEVGPGVHAWLRFGAPASKTKFDFDAPSNSMMVTESDGRPFPGGTWYVMTMNERDVASAKLLVECLD